jgi:hypothetical protein
MFRSPLFAWSPQPDQDQNLDASPVTQSPSRFGAFRSNVRTLVNGSSIYSQSPALTNNNHNENTPKIPFRGFWSRQQSPDPNVLPVSNDAPRDSRDSSSPLSPPHAHHTAGSYIGAIQDPEEPRTVYSRHPADVQLPHDHAGSVDPESQQLADEANARRHRRRKHRRRAHRRTERPEQWVRRRDERGSSAIYVRGSAARRKMAACVISGTFLIVILSICKSMSVFARYMTESNMWLQTWHWP